MIQIKIQMHIFTWTPYSISVHLFQQTKSRVLLRHHNVDRQVIAAEHSQRLLCEGDFLVGVHQQCGGVVARVAQPAGRKHDGKVVEAHAGNIAAFGQLLQEQRQRLQGTEVGPRQRLKHLSDAFPAHSRFGGQLNTSTIKPLEKVIRTEAHGMIVAEYYSTPAARLNRATP